jgi:hypothetical protein
MSEENGKQSDFEVIGGISYSFSTGFLPWSEPEEFVVTVKGEIVGSVYRGDGDEPIESNVQLGQLELWHVMLSQAVNNRRRFFDVFEGHSDLLASVHEAIFEPGSYDTKPELELEPSWENLLYLQSIEVAPKYRETSLVADALESAIATFCPSGIVVTDAEDLGLTSKEIFLLALNKVPGTDFFYRDTCCVNPHRKRLDD